MMLVTELEKTAERVIAGSCALITKQNNSDAAKLVQFFIEDAQKDGYDFKTTLEALARGGIVVALMAAEPDSEEVFNDIIARLGSIHE
jgi:hypothetical protein